MFKRFTLLLLVCTLLTGWLCPAQAVYDKEALYTSARNDLLRYLNGENSKTLTELCADFESLGRYQKSTSFLYYTSLLRDAEAEAFEQVEVYVLLLQYDPDFGELLAKAGFPSVAEVEAYVRGRMAEDAHDNKGAIAYYQQCGAMLDSLSRMRRLLLATPLPNPTATPTPSPTPTPQPTSTPSIVKQNVKTGDYEITTYSNGTCSITDYLGKATWIDIPEAISGYNITVIGDRAFSSRFALTNISIPDSVTLIGNYAFSGCLALTNIAIPYSVTSIQAAAFYKCTSLTSITIPDSVTSIGNEAFYGCPNLTLRVKANSYAHQYAKTNGLRYTTY